MRGLTLYKWNVKKTRRQRAIDIPRRSTEEHLVHACAVMIRREAARKQWRHCNVRSRGVTQISWYHGHLYIAPAIAKLWRVLGASGPRRISYPARYVQEKKKLQTCDKWNHMHCKFLLLSYMLALERKKIFRNLSMGFLRAEFTAGLQNTHFDGF